MNNFEYIFLIMQGSPITQIFLHVCCASQAKYCFPDNGYFLFTVSLHSVALYYVLGKSLFYFINEKRDENVKY